MVEAYETLADHEKRVAYDLECRRTDNIRQTQQAAERRETQAKAEGRQKKASKYDTREQKEDEKRYKQLVEHRSRFREQIDKVKEEIRQCESDLQSLQKEDDKAARQEARQGGWWSSLSYSFVGKSKEKEDEKERREIGRLQRAAHRHVIEKELNQEKSRLRNLGDGWEILVGEISIIRERLDAWARAERKEEEQLGKDEVRTPSEEENIRQQWGAWEEMARRAEGRQRAYRETKSTRRESRERFQSTWAYTNNTPPSTTRPHRTNCRHRRYWPRTAGMHQCENCQTTQRHFAFQCPECDMIACANCRQSLRGRAWGN